MKFPILLAGAAALTLLVTGCEPSKHVSGQKAEPQLGMQAWTFRSLTLADTLQKAQDLGIKNLEIFNGQELGGGMQGKLSHSIDEQTRTTLKKLAADKGVTIVSYGVITGHDEADWKAIFDFAKAMNLKWISSEPKPEELPLVAKLAKESGIRVALHNHPPPSVYWNPEFALEKLEPYWPEIGLCADTGHWARADFNPVTVLQRALPRTITLHFKDLNQRGVREAKDVPWGTGTSDMAGQILALRKAGFDGVALIEYENETPHLTEDVKACAEYFRAALAAPIEQLAAGKVAPPGFTTNVAQLWADGRGKDSKGWPEPQALFAPDLSNATFPAGAWTVTDGILKTNGGADNIWTKEQYGDFIVSFEFRVPENANSGVFIRSSDTVNWLQNSIEIQIQQQDDPDKKHVVGAIFDCFAPTRALPIKPGEWNRMVISANGPQIKVILNDEQIVDANLDQWTEAGKNPDGTPNKFEKAYKDMPRTGFIGFQDHGTPVEFRNILIEKTQPSEEKKK
jgi:sugar phosphate isomerase/epimerase